MKYKKSELTRFAKTCAYGANQMLNGVCVAGEVRGSICRDILSNDEELLLEVSKRFAKYAKDQIVFDVENGEVQEFQNLIEKIIECCEDNNWFNKQ